MKKYLFSLIILISGYTLSFSAELSDGAGSGYPAVIDTDTKVETSTTVAHWNTPNDLAEAIINIQVELGTNPAGSYDTVKERLEGIQSATSTLRTDLTSEISATDTDFNNVAVETTTLQSNINTKQNELSTDTWKAFDSGLLDGLDSTAFAQLSATQTFTGSNTFTNEVTISSNTSISGNLTVDKKLIFGDGSVQNLEAGSTILSADSFYNISSTSDIVMTATPTIVEGTDIQWLVLRNTGTFYIDIQDDADLAGSNVFYGGSSAVIAPKDVITLLYDSLIGGWVIQSHPNLQIAGANADVILVRNTSGTTIPALSAVYASSYNVGQHRIQIDLADGDDSGKMPAIGITPDSIPNGSNGVVVTAGIIEGDLSAYSLGDTLYVSTTAGELTNTRPSVDDIQALAIVTRASVNGSLLVTGAGRSNDVPINFTANNLTLSDITSSSAFLNISTNIFIVGYSSATTYYGDGANLTGITAAGDNLGDHIATEQLKMGSYSILTSSGITGLKRIVWDDGTIQVSSPTIGVDNLGNHIATQNINVSSFGLVNVTTITMVGVGSIIWTDGTVSTSAAIGAGDMLRSVYDTDINNVVDNSELLDGRDYLAFVSTAGDTMSGDLDLSANSILDVSYLRFNADGDLFMYEEAANKLNFVTGGDTITFLNGELILQPTKALYFDGGTESRIVEESANTIKIYGGATAISVVNGELVIEDSKGLYLDGGVDTFIKHSTDNEIDFYSSNLLRFKFTSIMLSPNGDQARNLGSGTDNDFATIFYHTLSQHSTEKDKKNIKSVNSDTIKSDRLPEPKTFEYNTSTGTLVYGIVAEDCPEEVIFRENGEIAGINTNAFIAYLSGVIKKQGLKLLELENRISILESR